MAASRRRDRGQSLILAVIVMFVLLFVGGIFVGLVARNLLNTGRARETVNALEFAEAGLRFASANLENSPEGADWRPAPEDPTTILPQDPDRRWLLDGYSRIDLGRGRALIRVSMKPDPRDPDGKYIRIDSVGRSGFLNRADPTTFLNTPAPRLRREMVALKSIGLTDYMRFVTNRFNDTKFQAVLGVPSIPVPLPTGYTGPERPLTLQFGGLPVRTQAGTPATGWHTPGAPIKVNGDTLFVGNTVLAVDPRNGESVQIAGKISVDTTQGQPLFLDTSVGGTGQAILPSIDPNFSTFGAGLRDDGGNPDKNGYVRGISRLEPPLLDTPDQATGVSRYLLLTRNSGRWLTDKSGNQFNTGANGLGAGLFISNRFDVIPNTTYTNVPDQWMKPGGDGWNGPYYTVTQAVVIEPGYPIVQDRDPNTSELIPGRYVHTPGIHVVRSQNDAFVDPNGNPGPKEANFTFFIYKPANKRPVLKLENEFLRTYLKNQLSMSEVEIDKWLPEFNGVIYAQGNVRIRGLLASKANIPIRHEQGDTDNLSDADIRLRANPPALTVVSGSNIFIEGSLVRESAESMIALLAHDNVAVNPTMFVGQQNTGDYTSSFEPPAPPYYRQIGTGDRAIVDFIFGDDPTAYTDSAGQPVTPRLLLRHGAQTTAVMNLFVNEGLPPASGDSMYRFGAGSDGFNYTLTNTTTDPSQFRQEGFPLYPLPSGSNYVFLTRPGLVNSLRFSLNPAADETVSMGNYLFDHPMIAPMDIRIEALLYAQDGSFYIIPGLPLNGDTSDTRNEAAKRATAGSHPNKLERPAGVKDYYPFYGEPVDCRITLVGAIAENRTAPVADQAAWMQMWGWIPEVYGSTGNDAQVPGNEQTIPLSHLYGGEVGQTATDQRTSAERNARIARGLRFLYDPALAAPYPNYQTPTGAPTRFAGGWYHQDNGGFRQDDYGRTLPPLPRLPVCPGYVFYGEAR